jgi:hypothetical protein
MPAIYKLNCSGDLETTIPHLQYLIKYSIRIQQKKTALLERRRIEKAKINIAILQLSRSNIPKSDPRWIKAELALEYFTDRYEEAAESLKRCNENIRFLTTELKTLSQKPSASTKQTYLHDCLLHR